MRGHPYRLPSTLGVAGALLLGGSLLPVVVREGGLLPSSVAEGAAGGLPALIPRFPEAAVPLLVAGLLLCFAVLPRPPAAGRLCTLLGGVGLLATLLLILRSARPGHTVGPGALLLVAACLVLTAGGLARSGAIRGDTFVAAGIVGLAGLIALFILYPIGTVLLKSVVAGGRLVPLLFLETLGRYAPFWRVLRNSLLLALVVGVTAPTIGCAFALATARSRFRVARALRSFSLLPIITPPFVIGLAIILLFGLQGTITAGLLGLQTRGVFGFPGLVLAQTLSFAPVAYLVLAGVVESMSPALEEASLTLRASPWTTFWRVTFPLLRPGLANAFLLTVIESLADFGNPIILGGDFEVLATEIYFAIIGRFDQTLAATLGVILLGFTLTTFLLQRYWVGERSYVVVTGKPTAARLLPLPRALEGGLLAVCLSWSAFTLIIYASVVLGGFVRLWGINNRFTLEHYRGLATDGVEALQTTVLLAGLSAPLTAAVGLLLAYLVMRHAFPGRMLLEFCAMLSFAVPGTVIGIGYILAFNEPPLLLTGTATIIVISFVFRNMPVGIRSGVAALAQIDRALEEASLTLRASFATTVRRVLLPLIRPALISALVFSFVRSMTAISAVVFLVSAKWQVSTKVILDQAENGRIGLATAYSTVLIVLMGLAIGGTYLLVGRFVRSAQLEGGAA